MMRRLRGKKQLVIYLVQATPRLSEDKVKQCLDPKLKDDYPPKAVAKVRNAAVGDTAISPALGNGMACMLHLLAHSMTVLLICLGCSSVLRSSRRWQRCASSTRPTSGPT